MILYKNSLKDIKCCEEILMRRDFNEMIFELLQKRLLILLLEKVFGGTLFQSLCIMDTVKYK